MPEEKKPVCRSVGPKGVFAAARAKNNREYRQQYSDARDYCHQRGYHETTESLGDTNICVHCDVWLPRNEEVGLPFRLIEN